MTTGEAYALPAHVQRFFTERLIGQKEAQPTYRGKLSGYLQATARLRLSAT